MEIIVCGITNKVCGALDCTEFSISATMCLLDKLLFAPINVTKIN